MKHRESSGRRVPGVWTLNGSLPAWLLPGLLIPWLLLPAAAAAQPGEPDPSRSGGMNPARDLYRAGRTLITDGLHVYTAPARMSGGDALAVGAILAGAGLVYAFDEDIAHLAHRNEESRLLHPFWEVADFIEPAGDMGNTNAYYFGGVAVGYLTGFDTLTLVCAQLLEAHFIAGLGKNVVQEFVGRTRPFEDQGPRSFGNEDATSFPSGHTINIFQMAAILSHHADRRPVTWAAYGCAALVGIQRVRADMHWPSDVFLSAVYGHAVARAVLRLHEERSHVVEPHFSALGAGIQVGWRF
ncbi:phosphatase PAP2 family protein [bacterium]|nr:phosphatase PAP2 family protein [bacterium]